MKKLTLIGILTLVLLTGISDSQFVSTGGPGGGSVNSLYLSGSNLFAGTQSAGVFVYNGTSWSPATNGINQSKINCINGLNNTLYAGTDSALYKSNNNGTNWSIVNYGGIHQVMCITVNGNDIYLGTYWGELYKSTNNGINWTLLFNDYSHGGINAIFFANGYVYMGVIGVYASSDNGANWHFEYCPFNGVYVKSFMATGTVIRAGSSNGGKKSSNPLGGWVNDIQWINTVNGYLSSGSYILGGMSNGFFWSSDNGMTWHDPNSYFLPGQSVYSVAQNSQYFFAGTGNGVYKRPVSEINGIKPINTEIPGNYSLEQNYPNPFNPETKIKFSIPKSSGVILNIYNELGETVIELVNQNLNAGNYELNYDASGLTSGIYYYRINAGIFSESKKMILVK